ncbi:leuA [Symbiodinium natans]|uniref:LeuA protein n=1 Tax=Symbiodinium natans TaxID=878477 RepID=A0A812IBL4_9DINO|nr:leuA [Symbiodinium natans]
MCALAKCTISVPRNASTLAVRRANRCTGLVAINAILQRNAGRCWIVAQWIQKSPGSWLICIGRLHCLRLHVATSEAAAIKSVSGIEEVSTGALTVHSKPAECEDTASKGPLASSAPATAVKTNQSSCDPACAPDRGICGHGVCFCRSPYSGPTCELEFKEDFVRFGYFTVVCLVSVAIVLGFFAADIVWRVTRPSPKATAIGTQQVKKETWRPQAN